MPKLIISLLSLSRRRRETTTFQLPQPTINLSQAKIFHNERNKPMSINRIPKSCRGVRSDGVSAVWIAFLRCEGREFFFFDRRAEIENRTSIWFFFFFFS